MKLNHGCYACSVVWLFLAMAILIIASPASAADCYKYITFKNESAYVAKCKVKYEFGGYRFDKETESFPRGQEKKVAIPCTATSIVPTAVAIRVTDIPTDLDHPRYKFFKAEDRCLKLKGTTITPTWEPCDPPGTPPVLDSTCWKHITLKNEGAYAANVRLWYTYRGVNGQIDNEVRTGVFSHGMSRQLPVPCSSEPDLYFADPPNHPLKTMKFAAGNDYCFVLTGTHPSPRYELCAVAGEQIYSVAIRNYGAYSTELSVAYDHGGTRMNPKTVIHTQQRGTINVPRQATNVHVTARRSLARKSWT